MFWEILNKRKYCDSEECYRTLRMKMVEAQLHARGISDTSVLSTMSNIPRHLFVQEKFRKKAYNDEPLPIECGQTISQPYIVAFMTELIDPAADSRVLEIGTGSGYQTAILSSLVESVYTVEIIEELHHNAMIILEALGCDNVNFNLGNGSIGWKDEAPFDAILFTAAPEYIPEDLIDQLKIGGRMVVPVGTDEQILYTFTRTEDGFTKEKRGAVRFVPLI